MLPGGARGAVGVVALLLNSFSVHAEPAPLKEGFHSDIDETSGSTGYQHTCVIEHDGKEFGGSPVCWGNNEHGQANAPKVVPYLIFCSVVMNKLGLP